MKFCQKTFFLFGIFTLLLTACSPVANLKHTGATQEPAPLATLSLGQSSSGAEPTPAASVCGSWSNPKSTTGAAISRMYGEIRNCDLVGNAWVITTLGLKGKTGIIAVYRCVASDSACLDGQKDHPLSGWHFYKPPYQGEVTLLSSDSAVHKILVDDGGHQIWFDLETGTFGQG